MTNNIDQGKGGNNSATGPGSNEKGAENKEMSKTMSLNRAPIADAGVNQKIPIYVNGKDIHKITVYLDGTSSHASDGNDNNSGSHGSNANGLSYSWRQIEGPTIDLSNANSATASFKISSYSSFLSNMLTDNKNNTGQSESIMLVFELTVKDKQGASSKDMTTITVYAQLEGGTNQRPPPTDQNQQPTPRTTKSKETDNSNKNTDANSTKTTS